MSEVFSPRIAKQITTQGKKLGRAEAMLTRRGNHAAPKGGTQ
ncbi:hypothetical protein [Bradyrhizobium sp. 186]|nr:hypothetical protein [Bradyrhizobium sp. 186]